MSRKRYTDRTQLTWGDYKGKPLGDVPFKDLQLLFHSQNIDDDKLLKYIEGRLEKGETEEVKPVVADPVAAVKKTKPAVEQRIYRLPNSRNPLCTATNKQVFANEKMAKEEIRRIRAREQENKKPVRAYECEKCGGWHLTSMAFEEWEIQATDEETGNWNVYSRLMLKQYEKENEALTNRVAHLEAQLRALNEDRSLLQQSNNDLKKSNRMLSEERGKDKQLRTLEKTLRGKLTEIDNLRIAHDDLVKRLFLLEPGKKSAK